MTIIEKIELIKLLRERRIRECQESFWEFCKEVSPTLDNGTKLYNDDTIYLKDLANSLQDLVEGKLLDKNGDELKGLCISLPPRHGKSLTVTLFSKWYLGVYSNKRVIAVSYSQDLINNFSRNIRNSIKEEPESIGSEITYKDVFSHLELSKDKKSLKNWSLEDTTHQFTFVTASFNTAVTGLGTDLMIIDDPHKNSKEAMNDKELEEKWNTFTNTFISRIEGNAKLIVIQTRWSENDIIGRLKRHDEWKHKLKFINEKVVKEDTEGNLHFLNESIMDEKAYNVKKSIISEMIFEANYNQKIIDLDVALYKKYKLYDELPDIKDKELVGVIDPSADGKDYTAVLIGYYYKSIDKIYLTDIYYDNSPITKTEDDIVNFLIDSKVERVIMETNSAFVILYNNIKNKLKRKGHIIDMKKFTQRQNKKERILTASNAVQLDIYFMPDFKTTHYKVYQQFSRFKADFNANKHDDFEDALTLLWEKFINAKDIKAEVYNGRIFI